MCRCCFRTASFKAALPIEEGVVAEISETSGSASGLTVFPGFIDMHGDSVERELEPRVEVDFPHSRAKARGNKG